MIRFITLLALCVFGGTLAFAQTSNGNNVPTSERPSSQPVLDQSRMTGAADTYCVIVAVNRGFGWATAVNYSTFKVDTCSTQSIETLTAASARAQMATIDEYDLLIVTGPYYGTMNINNTQIFNPFITLGNLRFSEVSRSEFTWLDAIANPAEAMRWIDGQTSYNPISTRGDVNFVWFAGKRVYLLVSAKGQVYIMTGVNHKIAFGENGVHLRNLGDYLNLPDGWKFETKELTRVLTMNSHVSANVEFEHLIDEFGNFYVDVREFDGLFK